MDRNILWLALAGLLFAIPVWRVSRSQQRRGYDRDEFALAGRRLPALTYGLANLSLIALGPLLLPHLGLLAQSGLSYGTVALALVPMMAVSALVIGRCARLARLCGLVTPAELAGSFYQSQPLKRLVVITGVLVALALAVMTLWLAGDIAIGLSAADTPPPANGSLTATRLAAMTVALALMLVPGLLGGMGAVLRMAAWTTLLAVLGFAAVLASGLSSLGGLVQVVQGLAALAGKVTAAPLLHPGAFFDPQPAAAPVNMAWPGLMALSALLAATGLAIAPAALMAGAGASRDGLRPTQPVAAALTAGLLLIILAPLIGLLPHLLPPAFGGASVPAPANGGNGGELAAIAKLLGGHQGIAAVVAVFGLAGLLSAAISAAAASLLAAASMFAHDLAAHRPADVVEGRTPLRRRVRSRLLPLGMAAFGLALVGPADALPLALLAGAFALQLLPGLLGICFLPRLRPSAVTMGLAAGLVAVAVTSLPFAAFGEALDLYLSFNAWPLAIHPALWGLGANLLALLLMSLVDRTPVETAWQAWQYRENFTRLADPAGAANRSGMQTRMASALVLLFLLLLVAPLAGLVGTDKAKAAIPPLWLWQATAFIAGLAVVWLFGRLYQPDAADADPAQPGTRPRLRLKARTRYRFGDYPQPDTSPASTADPDSDNK